MKEFSFVIIMGHTLLFGLVSGFAQKTDESPTDDELMEIIEPELECISPNDRASFVELCITKRDECSEEQFSGKRAIFSWRSGITQERKIRFWQTYKCVFNRELEKCPVDGGWSKWSSWSRCKADCDIRSTQMRTRLCDNPKPAFGGDSCSGQRTENRTCVGSCSNVADGVEEARDFVRKMHDIFPGLAEMCMLKHCAYKQVETVIKDEYKVSRYWSSVHCVKYDGACPVNGAWSQWGAWSGCSVECGYGENFRKRLCDDPIPKNGGIFCQGAWYETKNCLAKKCDENDKFTDWSNFSPCSESCGKFGVKTSVRSCLNLELCQKAGFKGTDIVITVPCYGGACPVPGGWSNWGFWTGCSASCGTGRRTRMRKCDEPYPYNGEDCLGPSVSESSCSGELCGKTVTEEEDEEEIIEDEDKDEDDEDDDEDEDEEAVDVATVGEGTDDELVENVDRDENAAVAADDGSLEGLLRGKRSQHQRQKRRQFLIGKIKESNALLFTSSAKQSSARKQSVKYSRHKTQKVSASEITKFIQAPSTQPSDGSLNPKDLYILKREKTSSPDDVKVLTKTGRRLHQNIRSNELNDSFRRNHPTKSRPNSSERAKRVLSPKAQALLMAESRPHGEKRSAVPDEKDGTLSKRYIASSPILNQMRQPTSLLSRSRRSAAIKELKSRLKTWAAVVVKPMRKPDEISKDDPYEVPLNEDLEYLYTPWTEWSLCSKTCGGGTRYRSRKCTNENIVCRGEINPIQFCNLDLCPVPGGWSTWEAWNPCSVTCGQGVSERYRACDHPLPKYGGSCPGPHDESRPCSAPNPCSKDIFNWNDWTSWTTCSKTCGGGQRTRVKSRYTVVFIQMKYNSREETSICSQQPCGVDGMWAAWGGWSDCSKDCGLGRAFRDRTCTDPSPVFGGHPCKGQGSESMLCYSGPCRDADDNGLIFDGESYLIYPRRKHPTSFVMIFLRIKPLVLGGTIFHYYHLCKDDLHDCHVSIMACIKKRKVQLQTKVHKKGELLTFSHPTLLNKRKWQDVFVLVTEQWAEMRVNDDERHEVRFSENPTEGQDTSLNLVGELSVGANRQMVDGYQGKLAALRRNFKILKLFMNRNKTVRGQPIASHKVKRLSLAPEARHPDFENRYYSHLQFRESKYLYVSASFEITDSSGLLFFNGGKNGTSYISAQLVKGNIRLCLNCGQKPVCHDGFSISSGNWYLLSVSAQGSEGEVRLNEGDAVQVNCPADQRYLPRPSLYVGGGGPKDWRVVKRLVEDVVFYSGMIDTLSLNGWPVTYKMATIVGADGEINSLGYSFSDQVTELRIPSNTMVKLKCGAPQKSRRSHIVRIVWFYNMERLLSKPGTDIEDTDSPSQTVSQVNLHPGAHTDGVYACVLSEDGVLSVRHVFVLLRYTRITARMLESRDEWIGFIFLIIFLAVVIIGLCCYVCKDRPYFKRARAKGYSQLENIGRRSLNLAKGYSQLENIGRRSLNLAKGYSQLENIGRRKERKTPIASTQRGKEIASTQRDEEIASTQRDEESDIATTTSAESLAPKRAGKAPRKKIYKRKVKAKPGSETYEETESLAETEPEVSDVYTLPQRSKSSKSQRKTKKKAPKHMGQAEAKPKKIDKKPPPKEPGKLPHKATAEAPHMEPPEAMADRDRPYMTKVPELQEKVSDGRYPKKDAELTDPRMPKEKAGGDRPYMTKVPEGQEKVSGCRYPKTFAERMNLRMPPTRIVPREKLPNTTNIPPHTGVEPQPPSGIVDGFIQPVDLLCNPYFVQGSVRQFEQPCVPCPGGGENEYLRKQQCLQMCGNNYVLAMNFPTNHSHPNNHSINHSNNFAKNNSNTLQKNHSNNNQDNRSELLSQSSRGAGLTNDNWNFSTDMARNRLKDKQIKADFSSSYEENTVEIETSYANRNNTAAAFCGQMNQLSYAGLSRSPKYVVENDASSAGNASEDDSERHTADTLSSDMEWEQFTTLRQKSNIISKDKKGETRKNSL